MDVSLDATREAGEDGSQVKIIRTVWPFGCGILAQVKDGIMIKVAQ